MCFHKILSYAKCLEIFERFIFKYNTFLKQKLNSLKIKKHFSICSVRYINNKIRKYTILLNNYSNLKRIIFKHKSYCKKSLSYKYLYKFNATNFNKIGDTYLSSIMLITSQVHLRDEA